MATIAFTRWLVREVEWDDAGCAAYGIAVIVAALPFTILFDVVTSPLQAAGIAVSRLARKAPR